MGNIREILALNIKENRRRLGMSQPELAELANLSTHYISMIEISRKFPTPEVLERLAEALGIAAHELFEVPPLPENALERMHKDVLSSIKQTVNEAVKEAILEQFNNSFVSAKTAGNKAPMMLDGSKIYKNQSEKQFHGYAADSGS